MTERDGARRAKNRSKHERITDILLRWYEENARELPWRKDKDPYHIWVSEIMLQQTRIEAVKGHYARFLSEAPDIPALAALPEDRLLKLWEGLGYYARARNLKRAAQMVTDRYGGKLPETAEELRKLPGIGAYTAGAVSSIAFGKREALVDGNVLRVLARLFADGRDVTAQTTKAAVHRELEERFLPAEDALCGVFNEALMELGETVCLPEEKPRCGSCPLTDLCEAYRLSVQADYPVRAPGKKRRIEKRTVLLLRLRQQVFLRKRPQKGLLAGLYEFPSYPGFLPEEAVRAELIKKGLLVGSFSLQEQLPPAKHLFTHVEWRMRGYLIFVDERAAEKLLSGGFTPADVHALHGEIALPSAFKVYRKICLEMLSGGERKRGR